VLSLRGVEKAFGGAAPVLAPVDLDIDEGEFVTLLGPSGCGKTTLLNLFAGLLAPTRGSIRWWGSGRPGRDAGRRLAYVFQSPTLMPWARVDTNVRLPLDLAAADPAAAAATVATALDQVGLGGFARAYPRELSGGMQMRVSIARARVTAPSLLLMDEPFGALDEFSRERLDSELALLAHQRRLTVAFVTHSIAEAVFLSTRIVVMGARPGRVLDEVAVDAAFPRNDDWRTAPEFARIARRISACVRAAGEGFVDAR
jgi:NitT/TauT family transport system ATP-binding protein